MDRGTKNLAISGQVRTGLGHAAGFTSRPWVRREFRHSLGIEPFPGTLNLALPPQVLADWRALGAGPGLGVPPESPSDCGARCYPVLASAPGRGPITASILVPEVPGYAPDQVEVLAAVSLREALQVQDGDSVTLSTVSVSHRRAVLFDVDGTLVNSIHGYQLAAQRAVEPYGWSVSEEAVSRAMNFGEPFWSLVVPAEALEDPDLIPTLRQATMTHWSEILRESVLVQPGTAAMLSRLRQSGIRLGICTASRGESFRPLEEAGLLDFFDEIITARDVERRKPDPEGLFLCLERMGIDAAEAVYVGDTVADIRASHAAGLYAVGVLTGAGNSALLSVAGAHRILPDLHQLPEVLLGQIVRASEVNASLSSSPPTGG